MKIKMKIKKDYIDTTSVGLGLDIGTNIVNVKSVSVYDVYIY